LGRAHNFARPHSESSQPDQPSGQLHGLLRELMSPYQSADGGRVDIRCDEIRLDDKGATPLALIIHELATNSAKYGALSRAEGQVTIDASLEGDTVALMWSEIGGPTIEAEPTEVGFGTRLAKLSVEQQLGGTLVREWLPQGLRVTIRVEHSHLHRGA
jgi:two-component sensor histidine kinase